MDLLKINDKGRALYLKNGDWAAISDIEPDDLVALIEAVARSKEPVGLDECTRGKEIKNQIEKVIYEEVYKVLNGLNVNREAYVEECRERLGEIERKYGLVEVAPLEEAAS